MRNIYTDEAGTTSPEPISVVVALIVNPDIHWHPVMSRLRLIWDQHIPDQYRRHNRHGLHRDFTFHAKDVVDARKYPRWPDVSRRALLQDMMALPKDFEIPVSFAAVKRGVMDWSGWPVEDKNRMTPAKSDHLTAFVGCIGEANRIMQTDYSGELAQVISDQHTEMTEILRQTLNRLQGQPLSVPIQAPWANREPRTRERYLSADRTIDEVHFLERRNAPFLQVADACAFGLRRYLSGHLLGSDHFLAIAGTRSLQFPAAWDAMIATVDNHKTLIAVPPENRVIVVEYASQLR